MTLSFWTKLNILILTRKPRMEMYIARLTVFWGLWVFNPAINTFASSHAFDFMKSVASEEIWGSLLIFIGVRLWYALKHDDPKLRRDTMFGALIVWLLITVMAVSANWTSTGTIVYPMLTYYILRLYLLFSQEYVFWRHSNESD